MFEKTTETLRNYCKVFVLYLLLIILNKKKFFFWTGGGQKKGKSKKWKNYLQFPHYTECLGIKNEIEPTSVLFFCFCWFCLTIVIDGRFSYGMFPNQYLLVHFTLHCPKGSHRPEICSSMNSGIIIFRSIYVCLLRTRLPSCLLALETLNFRPVSLKKIYQSIG